jgi:hypothetical protein
MPVGAVRQHPRAAGAHGPDRAGQALAGHVP